MTLVRQYKCGFADCSSAYASKRNNMERHVWTRHVREMLNFQPHVRYVAHYHKTHVDKFVLASYVESSELFNNVTSPTAASIDAFDSANDDALSDGGSASASASATTPRSSRMESIVSSSSYETLAYGVSSAPHQILRTPSASDDEDSFVAATRYSCYPTSNQEYFKSRSCEYLLFENRERRNTIAPFQRDDWREHRNSLSTIPATGFARRNSAMEGQVWRPW